LNELAVILANNPDVQMGAFTSDFSVAFKTTLCSTGLLLSYMILCACCIFKVSTQVKNSNPLEGAVVGCYRNHIEGIDREFKVTKASESFSFYNKSGDMFTHPLEVMKTTRLNSNAELKSHYELVGRDLARFYESKRRLQNKN
jgi:hypothetical protein